MEETETENVTDTMTLYGGTIKEESITGGVIAIAILSALLVISLVALTIQYYIRKALKRSLAKKSNPGVPRSLEATSIESSILDASRSETLVFRGKTTSERAVAPVNGKGDVGGWRKGEGEKDVIGMTSSTFAAALKSIAAFLAEYSDHPEQYDVSSHAVPGFIYNRMESHAPMDPVPFEDVLNEFKEVVFPGLNHWQHPAFLGYFPCGRAFPDMLSEMITSAMAIPCADWASSASLVELEISMVNWTGRALGLPEAFLFHGNSESSPGGGTFTESASESIFLAVIAARTRKINQLLHDSGDLQSEDGHFLVSDKTKKRMDRQHEMCAKLIVYSSREAHSSIEKACQMATVAHRAIEGKKENDFGIRGDQLEEAIQKDLASGHVPCMVHATLGTTSSCAFDRLEEIVVVASKYDMWVHVDTAYAGTSWVDPALRSTMAGIEGVSSLNCNLHKMLLHSNSTSLVWTRDQKTFRAALKDHYGKENKYGVDMNGWSTHEKRRSKALKVWFMMRMYGTEGLKAHVHRMQSMCDYLRHLMSSHPNIRFFGERKVALFAFQYFEDGMSEEDINFHSNRLSTYLNESHQMIITHSKVGSHNILRISIGYENTMKEDMERMWKVMKELIETYRDRKDDPTLVLFPPEAYKSGSIRVISDQKIGSPLPAATFSGK